MDGDFSETSDFVNSVDKERFAKTNIVNNNSNVDNNDVFDDMEGGKKRKTKKSSKKSSKGGAERINPIVLAGKIATALFREFGEQTNELNAKGEKKWKLSDIKDGIPYRTTLGRILKENNGDLDKAIEDAKKRYKSGALQKAVKATADQQQAKKNSKKMSRTKKSSKKSSKKTSKKTSKKASKKASKKSSKKAKK